MAEERVCDEYDCTNCGFCMVCGVHNGEIGRMLRGQRIGVLRLVHPGSVLTRDYRPDRLNVHVDNDGNFVKMARG